jgi:hypothetical protein
MVSVGSPAPSELGGASPVAGAGASLVIGGGASVGVVAHPDSSMMAASRMSKTCHARPILLPCLQLGLNK